MYKHISEQPIDDDVSLMGGQMGFALVEAYAQRYYGQTDDERLWERIEKSLSAIQTDDLGHSFAAGISGIAWGFLHLHNAGFVNDIDAQDIVSDLDKPLFELSLELIQKGDYDYLHGGLSAGLYYLERQPSPTIEQYVVQLVDALATTAVRLPTGEICWPFGDFGRWQPGEPVLYNPGLSHGTASIVALLRLFYERGYAANQCAELIQGALLWLWSKRNQSGKSVFPTMVTEDQSDQDSRLGWCYGDLGIANTFWLCGKTFHNAHWQSIALQTFLKAAQRRQPQDTGIRDANFCHGSAGVAHFFRQFNRQTPHPLLTEAADYWMQQTALYATPETDENVFLTYEAGQHRPNLGLLDGESSVGLVLLAELGMPTGWDRLLLLS